MEVMLSHNTAGKKPVSLEDYDMIVGKSREKWQLVVEKHECFKSKLIFFVL